MVRWLHRWWVRMIVWYEGGTLNGRRDVLDKAPPLLFALITVRHGSNKDTLVDPSCDCWDDLIFDRDIPTHIERYEIRDATTPSAYYDYKGGQPLFRAKL